MWIVPSSFCELPWLLLEDLANKIKNQQHMVAIKNFKNCFAYKDNAAEDVSFPQNKNTNQELLFKEQEDEPYETMGFLSQKKKRMENTKQKRILSDVSHNCGSKALDLISPSLIFHL